MQNHPTPESLSLQGFNGTPQERLEAIQRQMAESGVDQKIEAQYPEIRDFPERIRANLTARVSEFIENPVADDAEMQELLDSGYVPEDPDFRALLQKARAAEGERRWAEGERRKRAEQKTLTENPLTAKLLEGSPHYTWPKPQETVFDQQLQEAKEAGKPYEPKGNTPVGYLKGGIREGDILLGKGFLERGSAMLLAGPSGIGKSSIAMQSGCCLASGEAAFDLEPPRPLRIVMMQVEDSFNDLVRQSAVLRHLDLSEKLIAENFWIETVRGKIGEDAVEIARDLVKWWRADLLIFNPLSAYHDGDISQNSDNIAFLYGLLGELLEEARIGFWGFHHKGKPPKGQHGKNSQQAEDVYYQIMYDILGGSVLTNFFRAIITVSPIGNSEVFKFSLAKRFEESGWPFKMQQFKWHEDREKRLWVPASVAESTEARKTAGKTLEDLYKLVPVTGTVPKDTLEREAMQAGFVRRDYRGLLAQALDDCTPNALRLYQWSVYNPLGLAKASISRFAQPDNETHQAIKEKKAQERKSAKTRPSKSV